MTRVFASHRHYNYHCLHFYPTKICYLNLYIGIEYVVDMVSMDGVHKCVALWEYDRRAINGAGFVCMGQRLMCDDEERVSAIVDYEKKVLDALGIFNGPSHGEVKWHQGKVCFNLFAHILLD